MGVYMHYSTETGEPLGRVSVLPESYDSLIEAHPDTGLIEMADMSVDPSTHYVDLAGPTIRPKVPLPYSINKPQITADGLDEFIVLNLPLYCEVIWPDGVSTEVNDGSVEYSVDFPGVYTFKLRSRLYLPVEVTVEALALS